MSRILGADPFPIALRRMLFARSRSSHLVDCTTSLSRKCELLLPFLALVGRSPLFIPLVARVAMSVLSNSLLGSQRASWRTSSLWPIPAWCMSFLAASCSPFRSHSLHLLLVFFPSTPATLFDPSQSITSLRHHVLTPHLHRTLAQKGGR